MIDEYDVPLENAYFRGFYGEMVDFIRSLFESALKTNDNLQFAVITGCLRISKSSEGRLLETIFTGLNHLKIISVLDQQYGEHFGFTETEVLQMMAYYGVENRFPTMKEWYDGYTFGNTEVYNPWSVINCTRPWRRGCGKDGRDLKRPAVLRHQLLRQHGRKAFRGKFLSRIPGGDTKPEPFIE